MTSLLPPNATALERHIETISARTTNLPVPLRDLLNADTCETQLLPWLAWSRGVESWQSYWLESLKRQKIKSAHSVKRHKGTMHSLRTALSVFGAAVVVQENWQQNPPGAPHSFDIAINVNTLSGDQVTAEFLNDIYTEAQRTKPARSYFSTSTGLNASGQVGVVALARARIYRRLKLDSKLTYSATLNTAGGAIAASLTRLSLSEPTD